MFKVCQHFLSLSILTINIKFYKNRTCSVYRPSQGRITDDSSGSPLYQVNGKTVPSGESQLMNDKDWGYVLRSETQTLRPQSLNFYHHHSCTIQQAMAK